MVFFRRKCQIANLNFTQVYIMYLEEISINIQPQTFLFEKEHKQWVHRPFQLHFRYFRHGYLHSSSLTMKFSINKKLCFRKPSPPSYAYFPAGSCHPQQSGRTLKSRTRFFYVYKLFVQKVSKSAVLRTAFQLCVGYGHVLMLFYWIPSSSSSSSTMSCITSLTMRLPSFKGSSCFFASRFVFVHFLWWLC